MIKLIVGLGNPGTKYRYTRHNVGFMLLDYIAGEEGIVIGQERCRSLTGKGTIAGREAVLAKPQTYMNASGEAVLSLLTTYNVQPANTIVIYDDLALPTGQIRIRPGGSAGGHNGIRSIIQTIGDRFIRVRVGIGAPGGNTVSYVLSDFPDEEKKIISDITPAVYSCIKDIILHGAESAMNTYNGLHRQGQQKERDTHGI